MPVSLCTLGAQRGQGQQLKTTCSRHVINEARECEVWVLGRGWTDLDVLVNRLVGSQ